MAEEKDLRKAREVYDTLCKALDGENWKYKKDESNEALLKIECGAQGEDLPIDIRIIVDAERQNVLLLSKMPFAVPEDKRLDMAVAVSLANHRLVDGCFDYDVVSGNFLFRMSHCFIESNIGSAAFAYMLYCSCSTVDDFNDKFFMLAKGMLSLEQFIEAVNK